MPFSLCPPFFLLSTFTDPPGRLPSDCYPDAAVPPLYTGKAAPTVSAYRLRPCQEAPAEASWEQHLQAIPQIVSIAALISPAGTETTIFIMLFPLHI